MQLTFTEDGVQFVDIPITDDSLVEGNEFFTVSLTVDSQPQNVIVLQPDPLATVFILDGDGKQPAVSFAYLSMIDYFT